ncbi:MAG: glycosyltransferase family 4 protein [Parvibaculum sp.]|nr:glycosyltransferase family 4 protein [Parvibaculum sp.]
MAVKRLKIVQAIFTQGFAGSERICVELCNELCLRHDVLLLVADDCDAYPGHSILEHVSPLVKVKKIPRGFRPLRVALAAWRFGADIYHGHLGRAVDYARFMPPGIARIAHWHMGRAIKAAWLDGVVLISEWQTELLPAKTKMAHAVVPNWVSDFKHPPAERIAALRAEFNIGADDFAIGLVARPAPNKGIEEAVEAFRRWNKADAHFLVVGGTAAGLQYNIETGNPHIRFTGYRTDVRDLYSAFDCMVAPSYAEPFGLVVIEAMRAGTRVLVRNTSGLKDIAAKNADVLVLPTSEPDDILEGFKRAYDLRLVPPRYDMAPYERVARIADVERFYRELVG